MEIGAKNIEFEEYLVKNTKQTSFKFKKSITLKTGQLLSFVWLGLISRIYEKIFID